MEKITFELAIEQVEEIIASLTETQDKLYKAQLVAKNNELRDKLLRRFMTIEDLLSIFEDEKVKFENV